MVDVSGQTLTSELPLDVFSIILTNGAGNRPVFPFNVPVNHPTEPLGSTFVIMSPFLNVSSPGSWPEKLPNAQKSKLC